MAHEEKEHIEMLNRYRQLLVRLDYFDSEEPMTAEQRELFRHYISTGLEHLARDFISDRHDRYVEILVDTWEKIARFISLLTGTEEPLFSDDKPTKRSELDSNDQHWWLIDRRRDL